MPIINWFRLIADLQKHGMSYKSIGVKVEVSQSTIINWKNGVYEPRFSEGLEMIDLHKRIVCGKGQFSTTSS